MKKEDMEARIRETPEMTPVFRVIKVSPALERIGVKKGNLFYRYLEGSWVSFVSTCKFNPKLAPGQVEFVGYHNRKPKRLRDMGVST